METLSERDQLASFVSRYFMTQEPVLESCVYVFGGVSSQEWSAVCKNEMVVLNDAGLHGCNSLPLPLTGLTAVCVPPISPSLRAESIALLCMHN
ncbi:hypothetical protein CEXT_388281 [Caerostris extrusa]|uniref:Uncharacterized protein n=1 Tax=Caerostris extrusa TaxID=172846 RepID=A0AAV4VLL6_CAEEX|nr:hypothetical protein CEXT_388281 [Caerostris extrusa]